MHPPRRRSGDKGSRNKISWGKTYVKPLWLDRRIAHPGPYLTLCLSEAEFRAAMRKLKAPSIPNWCKKDATTHTFEHEVSGLCCLVTLKGWEGRNPIEVAGMLVHEAVHVWQNYCDDIGERTPGAEQEAYGIQAIAQELLAEFARRVSGGTPIAPLD